MHEHTYPRARLITDMILPTLAHILILTLIHTVGTIIQINEATRKNKAHPFRLDEDKREEWRWL